MENELYHFMSSNFKYDRKFVSFDCDTWRTYGFGQKSYCFFLQDIPHKKIMNFKDVPELYVILYVKNVNGL